MHIISSRLVGELVHPNTARCIQCTIHRNFSTTKTLSELRKLSTVKIVDNSLIGKKASESGKKVKILQVYTRNQVARVGDKVLLSIQKERKKAYIVGCVQKPKAMQPRFDSNNAVLIDETGAPIGTRIRVPLPSHLRGVSGDFTKILSIATKFV
ncbi:39S ribosomal protein L14, mitochondrial-like [Mizuhopecten yessoensis]|uniref:Large ribosomal subunit protein uL14m n=1 Tax=Mizuhopecten yessoensis TaxID=6573 RepID=A0A210Q4E1_MIZYE|nr:39S ribosomal protein L14, mitochondrial-like [Mizuhopecten yessoensis]XP_021367599.1 39S ribosomal protein L14, mitochondrial-like [Mizuhopecten yessoensis]XP_021367600.1 39S ribosomal protein L14, mitochondrial-like [Mizuhopecten yessoensis]OWF43549.1 39S ribosomal protein L14, mitochondrial [Mizuhopecten yessoensis]